MGDRGSKSKLQIFELKSKSVKEQRVDGNCFVKKNMKTKLRGTLKASENKHQPIILSKNLKRSYSTKKNSNLEFSKKNIINS